MHMERKIINCETPVGNFFMILRGDKVIRSGFGRNDENIEIIKNHSYIDLVNDYFKGDKNALNKIKYEQKSTDFTNKVWGSISLIPHGKTINYTELAKNAGKPKAIRASASACGKNNITLIIPCHRVIRSDGKTGNYAYGSKIKKFLLDLEK